MDKVDELSHLEIGHIAIVIPSLEKASKFLASLGVELSNPKPFGGKHKTMFRGKYVDWKINISTGKIGRIGLEVIQPTGEGTPYREFLDRTGGGIHHISFDDVEDLEKERARLEANGAKVISSASSANGNIAYYLEVESLPGILIEIKRR
jgi:catechol 2,3-dioxygenase-like lactoylglutathione lyase family enzyme